jgi:Ca-activated chloride channel family protein
MKSEFTVETQAPLRLLGIRYLAVPAALLLAVVTFVFTPLRPVFSQSGRGQQPESKKQLPDKPKLPVPPPKIRLPENVPQQKGKGEKDSEDTIRINSDLVSVVVTIAGRQSNASLDLKPEDFEILEDGAPQEIANFARDADQPLKMVMLFDTSLSVARTLNFERRAAARFFERVMRPRDRAAVFSVSTDVVVLQDFTNRTPLLIEATRQLKAQGATSLYDGIYLASEYLKNAEGRRVIVIVLDGGDTTSNKNLLEALAQAQKSDAIIFAIFTGNPWPSQNLRDLAAERALEALTRETGGEVLRPKLPLGQNGRRQLLGDREVDGVVKTGQIAAFDRADRALKLAAVTGEVAEEVYLLVEGDDQHPVVRLELFDEIERGLANCAKLIPGAAARVYQ